MLKDESKQLFDLAASKCNLNACKRYNFHHGPVQQEQLILTYQNLDDHYLNRNLQLE